LLFLYSGTRMPIKPTPPTLAMQSADLVALTGMLPVPVLISHDRTCSVITGNAAAVALFGRSDDGSIPLATTPGQCPCSYTLRRDGQVLPRHEQPMQQAGATGETVHDPELEVIFADGEVKFITGYARPLYAADGTPSGVLGVYVEITAQRRRNLAQRLFARINSDLEAGLDELALMAQLAELLLPDLGDCCIIDLLDEAGELVRVTAALNDEHRQILQLLAEHRLAQGPLAAQGFATEQAAPLLLSAVSNTHLRTVALDAQQLDLLRALRPRSILIVPLCGRHGVMGNMLLIMNDSGRVYTATDQSLAQDIATRAALLLDNARLYGAERRARADSEAAAARALFLADIGSLLAGALDDAQALQQLARLAVPRFADLCVVYLAEPDGALSRFAAAHCDPLQEQHLKAIQQRAPFVTDSDHPARRAIRMRQTLLDPEIMPTSVQAANPDPGDQQVAWSLVPTSHLVAPLIARGRVLGAISFGMSSSGRYYDHDDLALAEELARRAALAIDNARLYHDSQEAVRIRDTFLSVASHELKTPLTSLLGQAQLIQRRILREEHTLSERDQRAIRTIVQQGLRLNYLISAMLDISRLETGQLTLAREPIDLGVLLKQVVEEFQPLLSRHSIHCELPEQPLMVSGDNIRLMQAFQNLLQNAVKYSPEGGPIVVQLASQGGLGVVRVSDKGLGIAAEALPQLFQRFYRAEQGTNGHISGLGVGLYVVREVVSLHGGDVRVESVAGEGSTFIVTLPLEHA
jgi:signal transduction histidine kinase